MSGPNKKNPLSLLTGYYDNRENRQGWDTHRNAQKDYSMRQPMNNDDSNAFYNHPTSLKAEREIQERTRREEAERLAKERREQRQREQDLSLLRKKHGLPDKPWDPKDNFYNHPTSIVNRELAERKEQGSAMATPSLFGSDKLAASFSDPAENAQKQQTHSTPHRSSEEVRRVTSARKSRYYHPKADDMSNKALRRHMADVDLGRAKIETDTPSVNLKIQYRNRPPNDKHDPNRTTIRKSKYYHKDAHKWGRKARLRYMDSVDTGKIKTQAQYLEESKQGKGRYVFADYPNKRPEVYHQRQRLAYERGDGKWYDVKRKRVLTDKESKNLVRGLAALDAADEKQRLVIDTALKAASAGAAIGGVAATGGTAGLLMALGAATDIALTHRENDRSNMISTGLGSVGWGLEKTTKHNKLPDKHLLRLIKALPSAFKVGAAGYATYGVLKNK